MFRKVNVYYFVEHYDTRVSELCTEHHVAHASALMHAPREHHNAAWHMRWAKTWMWKNRGGLPSETQRGEKNMLIKLIIWK